MNLKKLGHSEGNLEKVNILDLVWYTLGSPLIRDGSVTDGRWLMVDLIFFLDGTW